MMNAPLVSLTSLRYVPFHHLSDKESIWREIHWIRRERSLFEALLRSDSIVWDQDNPDMKR